MQPKPTTQTEVVEPAQGDDWLQIGEAAKVVGVSVATLRRWEKSGRISAHRTPTDHRRYRRADVEAVAPRSAAGSALQKPTAA